jgi:hypothetical protein
MKKKFESIYNMGAIILMMLGLGGVTSEVIISKEKFMEASFKERIEMLKIAFEINLINVQVNMEKAIEDGQFSENEEEKQQWLEGIEISKAIEATCKKNNKELTDNSVLFRCFLHDDSNPSMSWSARQHGFYCFTCNFRGDKENEKNTVFDLFDFIGWLKGFRGTASFKNSFKYAVSVFVEDGINIDNPFLEKGTENSKHSNYIAYTKEMNKVRRWTFHYPVEDDAPALEKLQNERGISLATAKRMSVMTWYPSTDDKPWGLCYWIFINDDGSYTRRLATINKNITTGQCAKKWWNPAGKSMGIFNTRVLEHCRQFNQVCFVTESAIDAMSCEELGYHAVGLNSVNNLGLFFREYVDKSSDTMFICLTDNDEAGKSCIVSFDKRNLYVAEHLRQEYSGDSWLSKFKDVNEALVADRAETLKALKDIEEQAKEFYKEEV